MLIAFSSVPTFSVRLPVGEDPSFGVQLIVSIRDMVLSTTQVNVTSVTVRPDPDLSDSYWMKVLITGNQNTVGQVLTMVSQHLNAMNEQTIDQTISNGVPATSIAVSSLSSPNRSSQTSNQSAALDQLSRELNEHADIREHVIAFVTQLSITTSFTIQMQATTLAQLTRSINQLTRQTLTLAADRCYRLAKATLTIAERVPFEDLEIIANQLRHCATHLLTAVNAPLQSRTIVLNKDQDRATSLPSDYETDLELPWSNPNLFADGDDFSSDTIDRNRNLFDQKQLANDIRDKVNQINTYLTQALNIHLTLGQSFIVNSSSSFMSIEMILPWSLLNRDIRPIDGVSIRLPSINNLSRTSISLQSTVEPLAAFLDSKVSPVTTNLSRSISLTVLDEEGHAMALTTPEDQPFELIIPRDPQLTIPKMHLQNVTNTSSLHQLIFNLHFVNITGHNNVAVHFEMESMNASLSYLLIYRFDRPPMLNSSVHETDGWSLFCSSNATNGSGVFSYLIDNEKTRDHRSVIFGLRELNSSEVGSWCGNGSMSKAPTSDRRCVFGSNYGVRLYLSSCLYADESGEWKGDGLRVGPKTNLYQTHCYSKLLK